MADVDQVNACMLCVHARKAPTGGMVCEKELQLRDAHGWADLGFPTAGPDCPHWKPKEVQRGEQSDG